MSPPALLVVTGLQREASIAAGDGVVTVCSGGNPALLQEKLSKKIVSVRPRESGDPEAKDWVPAFAGTNGEILEILGVLSFGLAGGLASHLRSGDIVVASQIVRPDDRHNAHPGWHNAITAALKGSPVHTGAITGHDTVVTNAAGKVELHASTGALAVDMESHIAAAFARENGLPFAAIRVISDPATRSLPQLASNALTPDGDIDLPKVLAGLLRRPHHLPALIAAGIDSERAFAALRRSRRLLGPLFGLGRTDL